MRRTGLLRKAFLLVCLLILLPEAASAKTNPFKSIERKYHIDIAWDKLPFPDRGKDWVLKGERASDKQVKAAADLLEQELRFYAKDIIQRIHLRKIVVAVNLTVNDRRLGGFAAYSQETFYLDAELVISNEDHVRQTFHHELFHMIDYQDDHHIDRDGRWERLNQPSFRYGSGGYDMLNDPRAGLLTDQYPGFLNRYGTSSVAEDKAEIYSHMVTRYALMEEIAKKDNIVKAKINAMKTLLNRFHPLMDERFWKQFEIGQPLGTPAALKAVLKLIQQADSALQRDRMFEAYRNYKRAGQLAQQKLSGKDQAIYTPQIATNLSIIYTSVGEPLDRAEKALKDNNAPDALNELESFEKKFQRFLVILEFKNRHSQLSQNEAIRHEKREQATRNKIAVADAAVKRGDYRRAVERYSSAARVFKNTAAAKIAQNKLDQLLADPKIVAAITQQAIDAECAALIGRAHILADHKQPRQAAAICDQIIAKYPNTEWAEKARELKAELKTGK